jgi:hypothetical protein
MRRISRAGRPRRPRHQERGRLRAPARAGARAVAARPTCSTPLPPCSACRPRNRTSACRSQVAQTVPGGVRPHHGRTGAAQPGPQRHAGHAVGDPPLVSGLRVLGIDVGPLVRPPADAGGPPLGRVRRHRPRTGPERRGQQKLFTPFFTTKSRRHGPGPEPVPHRHRAARRRPVPRTGPAPRHRVPLQAAGRLAGAPDAPSCPRTRPSTSVHYHPSHDPAPRCPCLHRRRRCRACAMRWAGCCAHAACSARATAAPRPSC